MLTTLSMKSVNTLLKAYCNTFSQHTDRDRDRVTDTVEMLLWLWKWLQRLWQCCSYQFADWPSPCCYSNGFHFQILQRPNYSCGHVGRAMKLY